MRREAKAALQRIFLLLNDVEDVLRVLAVARVWRKLSMVMRRGNSRQGVNVWAGLVGRGGEQPDPRDGAAVDRLKSIGCAAFPTAITR